MFSSSPLSGMWFISYSFFSSKTDFLAVVVVSSGAETSLARPQQHLLVLCKNRKIAIKVSRRRVPKMAKKIVGNAFGLVFDKITGSVGIVLLGGGTSAVVFVAFGWLRGFLSG